MELFTRLALALAVGLLIGAERGWHERAQHEGGRVAGIRTFGLAGLLGGLWAMLADQFGAQLLGFAFVAYAVLMIVAHVIGSRVDRDYGVTTVVASLVTFALGALAVSGFEAVAAAGAVVTASLLSLKPLLHRWLRRIEPAELYGALKLLLISVVVLPVLPNHGLGPWQVLNPFQLWWMVVLIAALSFAGYAAMKVAGAGRGILLTGLFGGLASSTAVTLTFSRMGRGTHLVPVLAVGVLVACGTMLPRMLVEVAVVNPQLLPPLALPVGLMAVAAYGSALWLWRGMDRGLVAEEPALSNPFQLAPALKFGLLLALIVLLSKAASLWLGDAGIYLLSVASGVGDVDAITLSLANLSHGQLAPEVAVRGIVLAAMTNTAVKGGLALGIGGRALGLRAGLPLLGSVACGGVGLLLLHSV